MIRNQLHTTNWHTIYSIVCVINSNALNDNLMQHQYGCIFYFNKIGSHFVWRECIITIFESIHNNQLLKHVGLCDLLFTDT